MRHPRVSAILVGFFVCASAGMLNAEGNGSDKLTNTAIAREWKDNFEVLPARRQWAHLENFFLAYSPSSDAYADLVAEEVYLFYRADLELEYATKLFSDYQRSSKRLKTDEAIQKARSAYRDKAKAASDYWNEYIDWYRALGDNRAPLGARHSPSSPSSNRPQVALALLGESYLQEDKPEDLWTKYESLDLDLFGENAVTKWQAALEDAPTTEPGATPPTPGKTEQEKLINNIDRWQRQDHWAAFADRLHKLSAGRRATDAAEADFYESLAKNIDEALVYLKGLKPPAPASTPTPSPSPSP